MTAHDYERAFKEFNYMDSNNMRFEHLDDASKVAIKSALQLAIDGGAENARLRETVKVMREAVKCGKTLRDTFGGNVGGGRDIFKQALSAADEILGGKE